MACLKKEILGSLRSNARLSLSDFSRERGVSVKKAHYEFGKARKNVNKFVPVLDFEALGFKRLIVLFFDSVEGLAFSSRFNSFFVNNSVRLDKGLLVEYVFFFEEEKKDFLRTLQRKKIGFDFFSVEEVIKQESFIP